MSFTPSQSQQKERLRNAIRAGLAQGQSADETVAFVGDLDAKLTDLAGRFNLDTELALAVSQAASDHVVQLMDECKGAGEGFPVRSALRFNRAVLELVCWQIDRWLKT